MARDTATRILNVADARKHARRILPGALFDYIEGGAEDEVTIAENERAFRELALLPRMGVEVPDPSLATTVLGTPIAFPLILAPAGFVELVHPDGAVGVARAAAGAGTISVLARTALCPPEELGSSAPGAHWFQINSVGGRDALQPLMARAAEAGLTALVVTVDGPPPGNREREARHGLVPPVSPSPRLMAHIAAEILASPRWTARMAPAGLRALRRKISTVDNAGKVLSTNLRAAERFSWAEIEWIRDQWPGALAVKGVLTAADAVAARDAGADAIIVSNHGGRALDGAPATMRVLPEVVHAVGDTAEVLVDGGVRRASDVVKAVCLGARAVLIGRPFLYGLAVSGQAGVERILTMFASETSRTMKLIGCPALEELDSRWLQPHSLAHPELVS